MNIFCNKIIDFCVKSIEMKVSSSTPSIGKENTFHMGAFSLSKYRENRLVKTKKIDRITLPIP